MTVAPRAVTRRLMPMLFMTLGLTAPATFAAADDAQALPAKMSLESSAETGDPFAAFVAGRRYLIAGANEGNNEMLMKGLSFLQLSADAGFAPAARFAGSLYLDGQYIPVDRKQAALWYTRAAEMGDPGAQKELGDLYASGDLGGQELHEAVFWYEKTLGNPEADYERDRLWEVAVRLGGLYAEGIGVDKDPARALALWEEAAKRAGYPPAYQQLAGAYATGLGGKADVKEALKTYYQAAHAYQSEAIRFEMGPDTVHHAQAEILGQMQELKPKASLTRKLAKEVERLN